MLTIFINLRHFNKSIYIYFYLLGTKFFKCHVDVAGKNNVSYLMVYNTFDRFSRWTKTSQAMMKLIISRATLVSVIVCVFS